MNEYEHRAYASETPKCDAAIRRCKDAAKQDFKPDYTLLPFDALAAVSRVFAIGASKYAPGDWAHENNGGGCHLKAALRHLGAHCDGARLDESGETHMAHAAARLLMYIGREMRIGES